MQLSINFENLFNSKASNIGDYDAQIGVDAENWPSLWVENLFRNFLRTEIFNLLLLINFNPSQSVNRIYRRCNLNET